PAAPRGGPPFLAGLRPPRCASCGGRGAWLCRDCEPAIRWIGEEGCRHCGRLAEPGVLCHSCRRDPPRLLQIRAAAVHEGPARDLVHALKYRRNRALAPLLATALQDALTRRPALEGVLVPVPLHPAREREGGFNQPALVARVLAARPSPPLRVEEGTLRRVRATPPQTHLDRQARRRNVADAFAASARHLAGETVI